MTLNITEPTVGGSSGTWGQQLNDALTAIVAYVNNVEANAQPVDSDLTAIAALITTAYGRSLLTQANAAAAQSTLGLGTAATQASSAFDPAGAAAAAQAASQPLDSDLTAIAALTTTTFGRSFLTLVDAPAARTLLGLGSLATQSGTFSGTSSGTNTGDQDLSGLAPKASVTTVAYAATVTPAVGTAGATTTINVGALTGNVTLANPTGSPVDGQNLVLRLAQDATGSRTVAFGAGYAFGTDVTASLIPSAASAKWEMLFAWNAADSKWRARAIVRGF